MSQSHRFLKALHAKAYMTTIQQNCVHCYFLACAALWQTTLGYLWLIELLAFIASLSQIIFLIECHISTFFTHEHSLNWWASQIWTFHERKRGWNFFLISFGKLHPTELDEVYSFMTLLAMWYVEVFIASLTLVLMILTYLFQFSNTISLALKFFVT